MALQCLQGLLTNHLISISELLKLFMKTEIVDGCIRSNTGHQKLRNVDGDMEQSEALQLLDDFLAMLQSISLEKAKAFIEHRLHAMKRTFFQANFFSAGNSDPRNFRVISTIFL